MTWLANWAYRKSITLSRASGAVTDYQMKLLVGESSGAVGEDVDCGGLCATDFDDLRFTAADGTTLLDYWIESVTGATPNQLATVWIEFNSIGTGATTFYMYYGNVGAAAASNGVNTFPFFDDFPGVALDGNKWTTSGSPTISVSNSLLEVSSASGANRSIYGKTAFGINYANRVKLKSLHNSTSYTECYGMRKDGPTVLHWAGLSHPLNLEKYRNIQSSGSDSYTSMPAWDADTFKILEVHRGASSAIWKINDADSVTHSNNYDTANLYPHCLVYETNSKVTIDWCLIRQWLATEPAWGAWGSEELEPTTPPPTTLASTALAPTTLLPTTLVPTTLLPTTLLPTTLLSTTLLPTTLLPTTLLSTTLAPLSRGVLVGGKLVNDSILFRRLVQ
jgi:hypothetical protein